MRSLDLTPPDGPIRAKYLDFVHNDDFAEIGFVGPFATAKSTALVDRLVRRAVEYPGSNILIARATLTSLKESTIDKLRRRVGAIFSKENNQEALFTLPDMEHPVTRLPVASEVKGIGLDRNDLERVLKSTEYSTVGLEEANEIGTDAHDMVQERSRQEIWHYKLKVRDMCMKLAIRWSKMAGRMITPDEVYAILLDEPRNPVGQKQLPIDHPMPGETVVASVWNPVGSDATWMRYVGMEHPQGRPTPQWVKDNVGIREKHVEPKELREDRFVFRAGSIAKLPDGSRQYVKKHDEGIVELITGEKYPHEDVGLIVQRYCIYAFSWENESRDFRNVENTYLMENKDLRKRHMHGEVNVRMGRVFPNYVDDSVSVGGHNLPNPGKERLIQSGYRVVVGLDQGGAHATAAVFGIYNPGNDTCIIFDEYVKNGVSALQSAQELEAKRLVGLEHTWGYDPAMEARIFDENSDKRHIDNYINVIGVPHGDTFLPGARGDEAYDEVVQMLDRHDNLIGRAPLPRLLVFENCEYTRATLRSLEWKQVRHGRDDWRVDVGDAIKIMVSMIRSNMMSMDTQVAQAAASRPSYAYGRKFKEYR